jgi:hypothetical protein
MKDITYKEDRNGFSYLDTFKFDTIIGIKDNNVSLVKSRSSKRIVNLNFYEIQDIASDLICKGIEIDHLIVFTEEFKQNLRTKIQEIINEYKVK